MCVSAHILHRACFALTARTTCIAENPDQNRIPSISLRNPLPTELFQLTNLQELHIGKCWIEQTAELARQIVILGFGSCLSGIILSANSPCDAFVYPLSQTMTKVEMDWLAHIQRPSGIIINP